MVSVTQPAASAAPVPRARHVALMAAIIVMVAAVDQVIKSLVVHLMEPGDIVPVIGDWLRLYLLFNPGAAFSMGENSTWLFTTIQLTFVVVIAVVSPRIRDRWQAVGLAMIAGGALGNLLDRLFRDPGFWFGHVVDYISVGRFAIFNLADASITVGVVVFVVAMFVEERRVKPAPTEEAEA
ncbi:signal peptidase II [Corynebacterium atrinae]|uniref:signal peptidase II n=1 Tax=Corynebacterium atrinae TaxID=1336740 RepID=UPI0025B2A0ED|nr:signal peptidase II [Corynebacterium atrinae]